MSLCLGACANILPTLENNGLVHPDWFTIFSYTSNNSVTVMTECTLHIVCSQGCYGLVYSLNDRFYYNQLILAINTAACSMGQQYVGATPRYGGGQFNAWLLPVGSLSQDFRTQRCCSSAAPSQGRPSYFGGVHGRDRVCIGLLQVPEHLDHADQLPHWP